MDGLDLISKMKPKILVENQCLRTGISDLADKNVKIVKDLSIAKDQVTDLAAKNLELQQKVSKTEKNNKYLWITICVIAGVGAIIGIVHWQRTTQKDQDK